MKNSHYTIEPAPRVHCPKGCNTFMYLLMNDLNIKAPKFYICWRCTHIAQVGVGPVKLI